MSVKEGNRKPKHTAMWFEVLMKEVKFGYWIAGMLGNVGFEMSTPEVTAKGMTYLLGYVNLVGKKCSVT